MPRNDGMPKTSQVSVQDVTVISSWASFSFLNIYRISWNLSLAVRAAVIRRSTRLLWMLAFEVKSRLRLTISRPSLSGWRSPAWCLTSMPLDTSAKASTRGGGRQAAKFISPSLLEYRPAPLKFRDRPICSSPAQCVYIYLKKKAHSERYHDMCPRLCVCLCERLFVSAFVHCICVQRKENVILLWSYYRSCVWMFFC